MVIDLEKSIMDRNNDVNSSSLKSVMGNAEKRHFKLTKSKDIVEKADTQLERLSISRCVKARDCYDYKRVYKHNNYRYDSLNELERYGYGRFHRNYEVIISFEDSLDFIYACLFKTKRGSLMEFFNNKEDYYAMSRQYLAGGYINSIDLAKIKGFSEAFDIVLNNIGSSASVEKTVYDERIIKFCRVIRDSLAINCGSALSVDSIIASVGITSLVYYSDSEIDTDTITLKYKMYEEKLKVLCVPHGKYAEHLNESFSVI